MNKTIAKAKNGEFHCRKGGHTRAGLGMAIVVWEIVTLSQVFKTL